MCEQTTTSLEAAATAVSSAASLTASFSSPVTTTCGTSAVERSSSPTAARVGGYGAAPVTTAVSLVTTAAAPVSTTTAPVATASVQGPPLVEEVMVQAPVVAREVTIVHPVTTAIEEVVRPVVKNQMECHTVISETPTIEMAAKSVAVPQVEVREVIQEVPQVVAVEVARGKCRMWSTGRSSRICPNLFPRATKKSSTCCKLCCKRLSWRCHRCKMWI